MVIVAQVKIQQMGLWHRYSGVIGIVYILMFTFVFVIGCDRKIIIEVVVVHEAYV
jgi:hypothetical protein